MLYYVRCFKNFLHQIESFFAGLWFGFPAKKLKVIGVTGTDGKTTTCYFIYHILRSAGKSVGLLTTVEACVGDKNYSTGLHVTTPTSWRLNKFLADMVATGCEYVVLETTSHALDQHRVGGVKFDVGVVTNVTHEHLDYHGTFERYLTAKGKLLLNSEIAILNADDSSYEGLARFARKECISYGIDNVADINGSFLEGITLQLPGKYNKYNALAAIAVANHLDISPIKIKEGLEALVSVPGRMDVVCEKPFKVIVDFAHTPNALRRVLPTVLDLVEPGGRLILIFGCAGLRDHKKRPKMGKIAQELADVVILTAEDPRTEDVTTIMNQISMDPSVIKIADRKDAIEYAICEIASEGDVVLITGKGHEQSMCFGTKECPWDDKKVAQDALMKG